MLVLLLFCIKFQHHICSQPAYQVNPVLEEFSNGLRRPARKPLEERLGVIPEEPLDINLKQWDINKLMT
jgi:hypothetical protein